MNKQTSSFSFDVVILVATVVLMVIGVLFIFSSGVSSTGKSLSSEYIKQIIWAVLGIGMLLFFLFFDYSLYKPFALPAFGIMLFILVLTLFFGKLVNGARSWIDLGFARLQPSEFMKISTILCLGVFLERKRKEMFKLRWFALGFGIALLPMGVVLLQPDMGTALVFLPIYFIMAYLAGARLRHILYIVLTGLLIMVFIIVPEVEKVTAGGRFLVFAIFQNGLFILIVNIALALIMIFSTWGYLALKNRLFFWIIYFSSIFSIASIVSLRASQSMPDYLKGRLLTFIDPNFEPLGSGWNIIQSVTAVGSGGFWGKGFLRGTQSHLQYLPEQSTDFIFSIIAEEWGFVGGALILLLFAVICFRALRVIGNTKDLYATLIGAGVVGMIFFHLIVNVGMAMGIMPVMGIPLMFLSYGGSSLWTALIGIGIVLNISFKGQNR